MVPDPDRDERLSREPDVHCFTVNRGMTVAIVIETRDWYAGLIQAALARVRIEGSN